MNEIAKNRELLELYLSEADRMIQRFERIIFDTGQTEKTENYNELFRILHTLKGSSAMMEYSALVNASHSFENIFTALKNKTAVLTDTQIQQMTDIGLSFSEYFKAQLKKILVGQTPVENNDITEGIAALADALGVPMDEGEPEKTQTPINVQHKMLRQGEQTVYVRLRKCPMPHIRAFIIAKSVASMCSFLKTNPENPEKNAGYNEIIQNEGFEICFTPQKSYTTEEIVQKIARQPFVESCSETAISEQTEQDLSLLQNVTVKQSVINSLINQISEIAAAETELETYADSAGLSSGQMYGYFSKLRHTIRAVGVVASGISLHDVGSVFISMQRTARSMARDMNKEVKVKTTGEGVRVEKSVLELLSDSLIHIVRNAVDHGIETPDVRESQGKQRTGTILLDAVKKNGYLAVSVNDDGAGIDCDAVLEKAAQLGRLTKPKEQYTAGDVYKLLLSAGLSTKTKITQYSGRGVGLDTVLRRVSHAGGSISVESKKGSGTVINLRIPLSLMLIDGIEVLTTNGDNLIIPANAVGHVCECTAAELKCSADGKNNIEYKGESYRELLFPGEQIKTEKGTHEYIVILAQDYGKYFIRLKKVDMISTYYIKKMPEYVSNALGKSYIYSGCVLGKDSKLRCVLDAEKLVNLSGETDS